MQDEIKDEIKPFLHNIVHNYTKPLPFENEPYTLETIPFITEHLDTYLFYIRHRSTTASTEYPSFQRTFPLQETSSTQTYRRTKIPTNLQILIQEIFYGFLNKVKEYNLTLENPKYSPNALEELEQYVHNFEVEDIERLVTTQNNPHHWLQADKIRIQNFSYHYFKDITLNGQTIPFTAFRTHFTADEYYLCILMIMTINNK